MRDSLGIFTASATVLTTRHKDDLSAYRPAKKGRMQAGPGPREAKKPLAILASPPT
jgi:hypothetical protein